MYPIRYFLSYLIFTIVWILCPSTFCEGRLSIGDGNNTLTFSTLDYFNYRQPYYVRNGTSILWPWANNTIPGSECTFIPVDPNRSIIVKTAQRAAEYSDTALFLFREQALNAGCQTIAQVGLAAKNLSDELHQAGFPPISLLVFIMFSNSTTPVWGPGARMYTTRNPSRIPEGPPIIDATFLNQTSSKLLFESKIIKTFGFYFEAEQGK
ncbi:hypothetical protein BDF19DRAFT_122300 [Syncephalis fuscata]|nr:hypothetical protein BDF19DRAFT_122300 [Syncephalis fuscata]